MVKILNNNSERLDMKILVFDDCPKNRKSASVSLEGHDVTVVGTYDKAQKALTPQMDNKERDRLFAERYEGNPYDGEKTGIGNELREQRIAFYYECNERATTHPDFDVVMTDLLVPASRQALGGEGMQYAGTEMPLGSIIALLALVKGVKNVAVVTDKNHHDHPASAAFDCFSAGHTDGINIICTNRVEGVPMDEETGKRVDREFLDSDASKVKYPYPEGDPYGPRRGLIWGKDWGKILEQLTSEG
jgi:CheY-like chemotaxis protein